VNYLSIQFAFFLAAVVIIYHLCPRRFRHIVLLVASYVFYFLSSRLVILGIFGATVFTFFVGRAVDKELPSDGSERNPALPWMAFGVAALVCYLALFKVIGPLKPLLAHSIVSPSWLAAFVNANSLLPLGISYYSFRLISYVVDVYWKKIPAERSFIDFAAYVSFFPHIVAGPIQRSGDFLEQIRNPDATPATMTEGLRRMLLGCFKKLVIADNLGLLVGLAYPSLEPAARSSTLLAFYLFPVQLYADFSALTDIAIGASLLFGIRSPENFDRPFSATSISQYWRRWHMSLTSWLTDYVFLPLRMATRQAGNWGLAFSLMVNMLLIGLWHNLSWTFAVFGLLHGFFLTVDALTARTRAKFFRSHSQWDRAATWIGPVFTFHLVALGSVFVRADSLPQAFNVLSRILTVRPDFWAALQNRETICALLGFALWSIFEFARRRNWLLPLATAPTWTRWAFYYAVIALVVKYGHNAEGFIYFKF
jgi:alginate O-acetyltransferase complex protein AlgI